MRKKGLQTLPNLTEDVTRLVADLEHESDRGVALLAAAFLDDVLDVMIRAALINDDEAVSKLCGIGRPLESFGARTHMAHCIGLLGADVYHDINLIREIRNDFAHRQPTTFDAPQIMAKCERLKCVSFMLEDDSCRCRDRFTADVVLIVNHLIICTGQLQHAEAAKSFTENGFLRLR